MHSLKSIVGVQCPTVLNPDHPYFKDYKTSRQILILLLPSGKRIETFRFENMEEREKRSNLIEIIVYVANIAGFLSLVMIFQLALC